MFSHLEELLFFLLSKILTGKPTGKMPLGRSRYRWEDNVRMNLKEMGINRKNWIGSAQSMYYWRALVNTALNLRAPLAMELIYNGT